MGWQDRDYARQGETGWARPYGGRVYRPRVYREWTVVKWLMAVNIGVFVLMALFSQRGQVGDLIVQLGVMQVEAVWAGQVWRLWTATYLHAGLFHILMNMMGLYFLGPPLEERWGRKKFFIVYTIAGVLGNVALMILANLHNPLNPTAVPWLDPKIPALGASGSILGLLGACAVLFPHAEIYVYFLFPVKIRTAAVVFGLLYVYNIFAQKQNFGGDACHIAGLLFGVWWAWQGDAWWQGHSPLSRWRIGRSPGRARKVSWREAKSQELAEAGVVDQILKKVYEGGIHSLTPEERRVLMESTERQRQADARAGRLDRL